MVSGEVMALEPWEAEDDLVICCTSDEEGNILLMNGCEWCECCYSPEGEHVLSNGLVILP